MAFVVDGSEWCFDGMASAEIEEALSRFAERTQVARNRGEIVWVGDNLQTRAVLGSFGLWELKGLDSPVTLSEELWQELAAFLSMAPRYLDEADWPEGLTEHIVLSVEDSPPAANEDVALAHHYVRSGRAVACLGLLRGGPHSTTSGAGTAPVHWVRDECEHRQFFRDAIDVERDTPETLRRLAPHAFPDLYFYDGVLGSISSFVGGYEAVRIGLRKLLRVLDDDGRWAFLAAPPALTPMEAAGTDPDARPSKQVIERRFRGLGVTIAPEKPNVYLDRDCRAAREIRVGEATLYCEWHEKLRGDQNRVHIHPPITGSGDRVIVAIFADHLPLP